MSLLTRVTRAMHNTFSGGWSPWAGVGIAPTADLAEGSVVDTYDRLRAYYYSNGLYDDVRRALLALGHSPEAVKPLRNPTYRVVEFYTAKLWGGPLDLALPIVTDNPKIVEPIQQVWTWSNWSAKKQWAARSFAMLGDLFLKVPFDAEARRVWLQVIDPADVTEFDVDERGIITWIRLDVEQSERDRSGNRTSYLHTEVWDAATQEMRIWRRDTTILDRDHLDLMGPADEFHEFSEWGIDFIPFVHAPFRDVGEDRGMAAITPAIDKIDEANRQATRLHQMLFKGNNATWVLTANGEDGGGRPLPPIRLDDGRDAGDGSVRVGDDRVVSLPGRGQLQPLVPSLNYDGALNVLNGQIDDIEQDLPEMTYYRITKARADISGRALRFMLTAAIDRVVEARGNGEIALIRANQMALSIGAANGLFPNIGSYDNGDFDHTFAERAVVPLSEEEEAQVEESKGRAAYSKTQAGWSSQEAMREYGLTDEQIAESQRESAEQAGASTGIPPLRLRFPGEATSGSNGNPGQA